MGKLTGSIVTTAALALLAALAGCGGDDAPARAKTTKPAETAEPAVDPAVAEATQRTTGALTIGRATAPVELRFALGSAPRVGQPVAVELALVTQVPVPTMNVDVTAEPEVRIVEPTASVQLEKVQAGTLQTVKVQAVPTRAGTSTVTVAVHLHQPTGSESRTFQLPIVVGSDAPGTPAGAPAAAPAASPAG
jgi:hypothetical protein